MPAKPKRSSLDSALRAIVDALTELGVPFTIIGGVALIARGVRRFTTDIDVAIRGDSITVERLLDGLRRHHIDGRIPDAAAFARKNLVLLLRHAPSGADLDLSFAWSAFEHAAIEAARKATFGGVTTKMANPDDLIIFKAVAGRPRDLEDIEALLTLYPRISVRRTRAKLVEIAELADEPGILASFDELVAKVRSERRGR